MMHLRPLCLSLAALALVSCGEKKDASTGEGAPGPATYALHDADFTPKVGRVYTQKIHNWSKGGVVTIIEEGRKLNGTIHYDQIIEASEEQLEGDRVRKLILSQTGTRKLALEGDEGQEGWEPSPLRNKAVILTRKDGQWSGQLEQGAATKEEQAEIDKDVRFQNDSPFPRMYGSEARQVGDTWTTPVSDITVFGELKDSEGAVTLTLDKVEDYQGHPCAFLTAHLKMSGSPPDLPEDVEVTMDFTVDAQIIRALDELVDLHIEFEGRLVTNVKAPDYEMKTEEPIGMKTEGWVK